MIKKRMKQILALLLSILIVCGDFEVSVFASERNEANRYTYDKYTGLTYKHSSKFDKCDVMSGIDVSKWNGEINWSKVKRNGIEYAIIRVGNRSVSNGKIYEDPMYKENIKGAMASGIKVGVYIYSQAITKREAIEEANYVLKRIKSYDITMPVVIDYEYYDGPGGRLYDAHLSVKQATEICRAFCETVEKAGYTPMIYANASMLNNQLDAPSLQKDFPIWLASWGTSNSYKGIYDHWQYTSNGSVSGIGGRVDCNFWYNPLKATGLKLSASNLTLDVGDKVKIKGTISPANSTDIVTWTSSDPTVAYIDQKGNLTAAYRGTTTITGTTTSGISKACKVTVYDNLDDYAMTPFEKESYVYTGSEITPKFSVKTKEKVPVSATVTSILNLRTGPGTDYELLASMPAGTKVEIYEEFDTDENKWYSVKAVVAGVKYKAYCGASNLNVNENYKTLSTDYYTQSYTSNINVGAANVKVKAVKEKFLKGTLSNTFNILAKSIKNIDYKEIDEYKYTGNAITPDIDASYKGKKLIRDKDYILSYQNNVNSGTATIVIKGIGNFNSTVKKKFIIEGERTYYISSIIDQIYTGSEIRPTIVITDSVTGKVLSEDNYTVEYINNTDIGTATAKVTAKGKYEGIVEVNFNITESALEEGNPITVYNVDNQKYTGLSVEPEFKVVSGELELTENDYEIEYFDNIQPGTAKAIIKGKNSYVGETVIYFDIKRTDISSDEFLTNEIKDSEYTGNVISPQVIIESPYRTLVRDEDYIITYENNVDAGTAAIILEGINNYKGRKIIKFNINPRRLSLAFSLNINNMVYTGSALKPEMNIYYGSTKLVKDKDYKVTYAGNTNVGTAKAIATGIGNYAGTTIKEFNILARAITSLNFETISSKVYNGKAISPAVNIRHGNKKLVKNKDYTVSYSSNVKIGKATIKVTGKNNYIGTKTINFNIIPKKVSGVKRKTRTKNSIKIKWNKVKESDGYEIYRSTKYDGKYIKIRTIKDKNVTYYTNRGLASGREYYYKVRAYKKVNGKKYYGSFSNVYSIYTESSKNSYAVAKKGYKVRIHAGTGYKTRGNVKSKGKYRIVAATYDKKSVKWYKVRYKIGKNTYTGYLKENWVNVEYTGKVVADKLNVRKSANALSTRKGYIYRNKKVRVTQTKKDSRGRKWYRIRYTVRNRTYTGYVMAKYIKLY